MGMRGCGGQRAVFFIAGKGGWGGRLGVFASALFGRRAHLGAEGGAERARHSLRRLDVGLLGLDTADSALHALVLWEEKESVWVSDRGSICDAVAWWAHSRSAFCCPWAGRRERQIVTRGAGIFGVGRTLMIRKGRPNSSNARLIFAAASSPTAPSVMPRGGGSRAEDLFAFSNGEPGRRLTNSFGRFPYVKQLRSVY